MNRFMVWMTDDELVALSMLANMERRQVRDQVAIILRRELEQAGLLSPREAAPPAKAPPMRAVLRAPETRTRPEAGRGA